MRILHHVNRKDFKKTYQRRLDEQEFLSLKIREQKILEQQEIQKIKKLFAPLKYDWRKEVNEGMTSSGVFFTTLSATGDVNLETLGHSAYQAEFTSGASVGSDFGAEYLNFSGDFNEYGNRYAFLNATDTSNYTTVNISVIRGNDTPGTYNKLPTNDLVVYYYNNTTNVSDILGSILRSNVSAISPNSFPFTLPLEARGPGVEIGIVESGGGQNLNGQQFIGKNLLSLHPSTFNSEISGWIDSLLSNNALGTITDDIKQQIGGFIWNDMQLQYYNSYNGYPAPISNLTGATSSADRIYIANAIIADFQSNYRKYATTYGISGIAYQRRTPVNVFVPLDSPEATSFIRTDPMMANLSPKERLQKLKEMLIASNEYIEKMLGSGFPGTGAVPPGEFDPFAQASPGKAGDTPGVEIAGLPPGMYPIDPMGGQAPAPKGYKAPGTYDPKQFYQLGPNSLPSPNLPSTPPGLSQGGDQDTQVAWNTPVLPTGPSTPVKYDKFMKQYVPSSRDGFPGNYAPGYLPTASNNKKQSMVASYEPQGQIITEKKKLKSPEEVLNKIPGYYDGKPAPLGFPMEPSPKMINGMHPDLVDGKNVSNRFNRMDPESARAMPLTGNPHIDKKVIKARKQPK